MRENRYQAQLIKRIKERWPECIVLKNDCGYMQGIFDLTVLHPDGWGALETKAHPNAPHQPNQDYYVEMANEMFFGAFIYPENEEEVLDALQRSFEDRRNTCVPQR